MNKKFDRSKAKENLEIEYKEGKDGMLYPIFQTSKNPEEDRPLGKYGRMAMNYLKENRKDSFTIYRMRGELMPLLHKIEKETWERLEIIKKDLLDKKPIQKEWNSYQTYRHK